jgi:POT family proton-dependent oligopeptide transporter
MDTQITSNPNQTNDLFGHPRGLFYLFFAELWERFSFYGMKALLVLYMTKQLLYSDSMSIGVFAAYMSLVYVTPMIGGAIADKIIGFRKSIILGGVLMAFGHFFLTIETPVFFYGSLALIIVGNGLFKPNISSFVGALYAEQDNRRDSGFTIFYLGINTGGAIAPLLCAWLAESYGWHYGFALAGIGMLAGLIFFYRGMQNNVFGDKGLVPDQEYYDIEIFGLDKGKWVTVFAVLAVPFFAILVKYYQYEHYLIYLASFGLILYFIYILQKVSFKERNRLLVAVYFTVLATLFWTVFEQAGSSLTLFADRNINLVGMNAAQTNSINSAFIILLAVPFSMFWSFLTAKKINPNSALKFGVGLFFLGLGFVVFALSANQMDALAQTPMFYLVLGYFILTVGEMFLSPIGLSKMTELSPVQYVAFIMGVWFASSFYGHFFAGKIAQMTVVVEGEGSPFGAGIMGNIVELITGLTEASAKEGGAAFEQLYSYVSVYASMGTITMLVGILAILISPKIKKMMFGVN